MDNRAKATQAPFVTTISNLLLDGELNHPEHVILVADNREISLAEIVLQARAVATQLEASGVQKDDPVMTMLGNGPNHVAIFLGISLIGALWVPLNPDAKGHSLAHAIGIADPVLAFTTPIAREQLERAGLKPSCIVVETDGWQLPPRTAPHEAKLPKTDPQDVRAVLFTSGTSGPPKGVMVSEQMLVASAAGTAQASDCQSGDVFLMWEPLHHIGGSQIVVMALIHLTRLVMVKKFSASRLWPQVRAHQVTKLHYLGGILEILLKARPTNIDRDHSIQLAFGGGCRPEIWRDFEQRFGIPIREVYGMTEASSFTTINLDGPTGSVGTPVPWFDVEMLTSDGQEVSEGEVGEIVVTSHHPGLFTPGYRKAADATEQLLRNGRLHSGDLGRFDEDGNLYYAGRLSDSLRRRGENISAWEVETALVAHPYVAECAVVAVPATIGEHEILCFVIMADERAFNSAELCKWCRSAMPKHHIPRYWRHVDSFQRTPSQRIRKDLLDLDLTNAEDLADDRKSA